jgi:hypothetical protein
MEDTLHKRLKAFGLDELQILGVQALIASREREARIDELQDVNNNCWMENPVNFYIDDRIAALSKEAQT